MSKTVLFEVFELLKSHGLVSTENEFSKDWLAAMGVSKTYTLGTSGGGVGAIVYGCALEV